MGIAYEMLYPIVEIYVIAENAVSLIKGKRTMRESITNTKKILFRGNCDFPLTPAIYFDPGKAPSLAIANTILVVTVMCENPPRYTLIASRIEITKHPDFLPAKARLKILITG